MIFLVVHLNLGLQKKKKKHASELGFIVWILIQTQVTKDAAVNVILIVSELYCVEEQHDEVK